MAESRWYRVIYHDAGRAKSLGRIAECAPTPFTLDPFLSRLLLAGIERGDLILVDEATKRIAVRRSVTWTRRRYQHDSPSLGIPARVAADSDSIADMPR